MRLLLSYGTHRSALPLKTTWLFSARPKLAFGRAGLEKVVLHRMAHVAPAAQQSPFREIDPQKVTAIAWHFEGIFRSSPPDLSEQILSTITSNPGSNCVAGLSAAVNFRCAHPASIDATVQSLVEILPRTADIVVCNDGRVPHAFQTFQDAFRKVLTHSLYDELQKLYHLNLKTEQTTEITTILTNALFSASAVKNGLLDEDFIYDFTRYGFQLPTVQINDERQELAAIGTWLQLITAGRVFMEKHFAVTHGLANVIAALKTPIVNGHDLHPRALTLLEKTIEAANTNFANPLSSLDAWNVLVPPE